MIHESQLPPSLRKKLGLTKRHKYNATKVELDGYKFDSQKEARYYSELVIRKRTHDIFDFVVKPKFILQNDFVLRDGTKIRSIIIEPDFQIIHNDYSTEFVDVKGKITPDWKLKWKMFKYKFRATNVKFTIV